MTRLATVLLLATLSVLATAQSDENGPGYTVTEDTVEIAPGTTMYYLVRDFYPNHRNDWLRVARDLAKANPQAFRNGDPGALIVGKEIKLIDYGDGIAAPVDASEPAVEAPEPVTADDTASDPPANDASVEPVPVKPAAEVATNALTTIGQISQLRGEPVAIDGNNRRRVLQTNATIYRGDTLLSARSESIALLMNDGAVVRVRGDARLMFEKYRYDSNNAQTNGSVMTLLRGGLRLTTGDLAELQGGVLINTAVATLTTTGGDLALRICTDGECDMPASSATLPAALYTGVALGEIAVSNNQGTVAAVRGEVLRIRDADTPAETTPDALGVVFTSDELTTLDLQSDEPLGFWAWFKQRFFSFGSKTDDDYGN